MRTLRSAMKEFLAGWEHDVATAWRTLLKGIQPAYDKIDSKLQLKDDKPIFPGRKGKPPDSAPAGSHVFRALDGVTPSRVRVVVMGQDPYPAVSQATGRSFEQGDLDAWVSCKPGATPSLRRIIQQIAHFRSGRTSYMKTAGGWGQLKRDVQKGSLELATPTEEFDSWQRQGVLFLNAGLTLTRYKPGGHPHQLRGHIPLWAPVVGALCHRLAHRADTPVVFLTWGGKARKFLVGAGVLAKGSGVARVADGMQDTGVVFRAHPATVSFLKGGNVFRETNRMLSGLGAKPVDW